MSKHSRLLLLQEAKLRARAARRWHSHAWLALRACTTARPEQMRRAKRVAGRDKTPRCLCAASTFSRAWSSGRWLASVPQASGRQLGCWLPRDHPGSSCSGKNSLAISWHNPVASCCSDHVTECNVEGLRSNVSKIEPVSAHLQGDVVATSSCSNADLHCGQHVLI